MWSNVENFFVFLLTTAAIRNVKGKYDQRRWIFFYFIRHLFALTSLESVSQRSREIFIEEKKSFKIVECLNVRHIESTEKPRQLEIITSVWGHKNFSQTFEILTIPDNSKQRNFVLSHSFLKLSLMCAVYTNSKRIKNYFHCMIPKFYGIFIFSTSLQDFLITKFVDQMWEK